MKSLGKKGLLRFATNVTCKRAHLVNLSGEKNRKFLRKAKKNAPKNPGGVYLFSGSIRQSFICDTGCHGMSWRPRARVVLGGIRGIDGAKPISGN